MELPHPTPAGNLLPDGVVLLNNGSSAFVEIDRAMYYALLIAKLERYDGCRRLPPRRPIGGGAGFFRGQSEAGAGVLRGRHLVTLYGRERAAVGCAGQAHAPQIQTEACPRAGLLTRLEYAVHVSATVQ